MANLIQNRQIIKKNQKIGILASLLYLLQPLSLYKDNTTTDDSRENTRQNSEVKLANRRSLISFLFKNRNIYATLNASNLNLTEERDSRR